MKYHSWGCSDNSRLRVLTQLRILFLLMMSALVAALATVAMIFVSVERGWIPEVTSSVEVVEIPRLVEPTPVLNAPIPLIIIDGDYRVLYEPIDPEATMPVIIVTVTPLTGASQGREASPVTPRAAVPTATFAAIEGYVTALPSGCTLHTVTVGESLSFIAARWGVDLDLLLDINGLTLDDALSLQPGDRLIIPWASCVAAIYRERDASGSGGATSFATEPPIALSIEAVRGMGNFETEEVVIRNRGSTSVDLIGWILSEPSGNEYRFGSQRLFAGAELRVATRGGVDLPTQLHWGLPAAIWSSGAVVTLISPDGSVIIEYTVP